jgi:hypothetical protein
VLPDWPPGTVTILVTAGETALATAGETPLATAGETPLVTAGETPLATAGETPHAIPVSAAVRAGPRHALIGLASSRGSLARLRADPRVSLAIIAEDVAITAYGRARVLDQPLAEAVVAVEIEVHEVRDHDRPTFAIEAGVRWRWTDAEAERRDADVRAALTKLAARRAGPG